jgi:PQQ-like domain/HEAT repeats
MIRCRLFSVLFVWGAVVAWAGTPSAQPVASPPSPDTQILKNAGIATDGPGLLDYFRRRTPSETEQAALRERAAQLGSGTYIVRMKATDDLIRAGRSALPALREITKKRDAETSRRAQYCIGVIEQHTQPALAATAARLLAERKPGGAAETLFAYLPFVDDRMSEDDIRESMKRLALVDDKAIPLVEEALTDKAPKRRAAAAWIVGNSSDAKQRQLAYARLDDEVPEVRFLAASSLLASREAVAVPTLIALLTDASTEFAWRSEDLLFRLSGENGPPIWLNTANDSNAKLVRDAWETWWKKNETKVDWKSLQLDEQALGLTLIVENQRGDGGSRIYETDSTNQVRWQIKITNPIDAQWLPGGRLLVGDSRDSVLYELDLRGNIGWKHFGIAPTSIQRLTNGNTVVSTYQNIIEITREGKTVFTHATQGHTYHARKLPDGHYVWIDACGEIAEVDGNGKLVAKTKLGAGLTWGSIERLRNGRYLVALGGVGKVQEVDMTGKVYWEKAVNNPNRAVRLANGNTLVASHGDQAIYEFDPNGNERWKHACAGRPFAAHRR